MITKWKNHWILQKKIYHMLKNNLMEGICKNYNQLSKSIFLQLCIFHLSFFFLFLLSSVSSLCELDFSDNIWLTKTPVLLPGKSHGQRSLVGCSPWALEELDTTEQLHFHFSFSCIGEGNGNPFQCSCPENPRDGGA